MDLDSLDLGPRHVRELSPPYFFASHEIHTGLDASYLTTQIDYLGFLVFIHMINIVFLLKNFKSSILLIECNRLLLFIIEKSLTINPCLINHLSYAMTTIRR